MGIPTYFHKYKIIAHLQVAATSSQGHSSYELGNPAQGHAMPSVTLRDSSLQVKLVSMVTGGRKHSEYALLAIVLNKGKV